MPNAQLCHKAQEDYKQDIRMLAAEMDTALYAQHCTTVLRPVAYELVSNSPFIPSTSPTFLCLVKGKGVTLTFIQPLSLHQQPSNNPVPTIATTHAPMTGKPEPMQNQCRKPRTMLGILHCVALPCATRLSVRQRGLQNIQRLFDGFWFCLLFLLFFS